MFRFVFPVLLSYICVKFCPVIQFDRCIKGVRCERRAQRDVKINTLVQTKWVVFHTDPRRYNSHYLKHCLLPETEFLNPRIVTKSCVQLCKNVFVISNIYIPLFLRTVPTIVIAHTFCTSPDSRISYCRCLLIQGYYCVV